MKNVLILFLSIIFIGCSSNDDDLPNDDNSPIEDDYSEYITKNSINTDIDFMPVETYSTPNTAEVPSLQLKISTTKIFPCANYILVTSEFTNENELIIRFDEILEPEVCLTATGPAISYIDLLENINKIILINGDTIDKYSVEITQGKVSITLIESNFTSSLYDNTFRYPENSFAYRCGTNTTNTYIYEDFLTIIEQNPNFTEFEFEGEGRIPYPESTEGNWVNHPSRFFKYTDYGEFENLENVLSDYSTENIEENSGVSISIIGWNNVKFYSWIND